MGAYEAFIESKLAAKQPCGITSGISLPGSLFPHQGALTQWALRRGRAAVFADTGLGKSRIEVAWCDTVSRHTNKPTIILTPVAVAAQTVTEGLALGIPVHLCRDGSDVRPGVNVTNYERLHRFDPSVFGGVSPDESSIIKHHDAKTFRLLTDAFIDTPFKLPATATPAPNDWTELGTHAEFLGICTRAEMLSEFFTHDGGDTQTWRLKGHARQAFWRWVVSWGALIRSPADLGFDGSAYKLPPLHLHDHCIEVDMPLNGMLFAMEAQTLTERRDTRKLSLPDRIKECVETVFGEWDGLETGVRRDATPQGRGRPSVSSEEEFAEHQRPGSAEGVHGDVLQGQPGEIQGDAKDQGSQECGAAEEVRGRSDLPGEAQGLGDGLATQQPAEEKGSAAAEVQTDAGGSRIDAGPATGVVRDMQDGSGGGEKLPDGGPLPRKRKSKRAALLTVQHGAGEVQGLARASTGRNLLSLEPWVIWCDLNAEQDALEQAFGSLAFSVRGTDSIEEKEGRIERWLKGERPVIISKPSILGFGLNMQRAARMAFVGVTDSYEAFYQAVRRCWRFGQKREVHVHVFASSAEGAVVANLKRKEREAMLMSDALSAETRDAVMAEVIGRSSRETNPYNANSRIQIPSFF